MSFTEELPPFLRLDTIPLPRSNLAGCQYVFFSVKTLAAAILKGCSADEIKNYLQSYGREIVEQQISDRINDRHSVIFYAAQKNSLDIMEILLEYGADPLAKDPYNMPLLAATIMWTRYTFKNADKMVALLLSYGADPNCIPEYIWSKYIQNPAANYTKDGFTHASAAWAKKQHRVILEQTCTLTIRYHLHRASLLKPPTARQRQIANLVGCPRLLRLPFYLIGQDHALETVMNQVMAYDAMNRKRPLVMAFAGLSGHGKTELASSMGHLLGSEICNVDMSKTHEVMTLFGAPAPYSGSEDGSPLNNYLARHQGKRCVVFLDEFDKTVQKVRESLLTILDSGMSLDLRSNTPVDVTKSIWILASNKDDHLVSEFYKKRFNGKSDKERRNVSVKPLQKDLYRLFMEEYTPAVTGRITSFLPFFPFSRDEAAVVAHKFLKDLGDQTCLPIDLHSKPPRTVGHIHISLPNDGDLCKLLSEDFYIRELGARSIQNCVDGLADEVFKLYARSDNEITETTNKGPHVKYTMQLHRVGDAQEVAVFEDGVIHMPSD